MTFDALDMNSLFPDCGHRYDDPFERCGEGQTQHCERRTAHMAGQKLLDVITRHQALLDSLSEQARITALEGQR